MSFHGGTGHKSPFTERAKATKSHLSPRRSSTTAGSGSIRPAAQQSLFGGQLRNTQSQSEVKEPTTPTRASEGSDPKGTRRDEFSSFNGRRVGTPIKTPRTAFGSIPPRSPKRPYIGSPKYQKVLLERPAFYNSPATVVPNLDLGKKEVSISELQKRLKRFLHDENVPAQNPLDITRAEHFDEVPFNISRSPRVNPLFYHDNSVMQVAKGGVAFTAGDSSSTHSPSPSVHSPVFESLKETDDTSSGMHFTKGGVAFTAGMTDDTCIHTPVVLFHDQRLEGNKDGPVEVTSESLGAESCLAVSVLESPSEGQHTRAVELNIPAESTETGKVLCPEDFPVYSESNVGIQVGESQQEDVSQERPESAETVTPEISQSRPDMFVELEQQHDASSDVTKREGMEIETAKDTVEMSDSVEYVTDLVESTPTSREITYRAQYECPSAVPEHHTSEESELISYGVEEDDFSAEPWSEKLIKLVVFVFMVACMMGIMAFVSGSQGLLPKAFRNESVVTSVSDSEVSSSIIPVSIGFLGMGKRYERLPCEPGVHLGLRFLSSTIKVDVSQSESHALRYASFGYDSNQDAELSEHDIESFDQLKSVTEHYQELKGKLLLDVASLTSESAPYGTSIAEIIDGRELSDTESVSEIKDNGVDFEHMTTGGVTDLVFVLEDDAQTDYPESAVDVVDGGELEDDAQTDYPESAVDVVDGGELEAAPLSDEATSEIADEPSLSDGLEVVGCTLPFNIVGESLPVASVVEMDVELGSSNALPLSDTDLADDLNVAHDIPTNEVELDSDSAKVSLPADDLSSLQESVTDITSAEAEGLMQYTLKMRADQLSMASPLQGTEEVTSGDYLAENLSVPEFSEDIMSSDCEEPILAQSPIKAVHPNNKITQTPDATSDASGGIMVEPEINVHDEDYLPSTTAIGALVAAVALIMVFVLKTRNSPPAMSVTPVIQPEAFTDVKPEGNSFPSTSSALKSKGSPVARPTRSVYDSYIPANYELDAISSPLKSIRTPRYIGMEGFSTKYGMPQPATSSPLLYQQSAEVDKLQQKPTTTWHPAMNSANSMSSTYRQTASYVPTLPSESGLSTSTRGVSEMNSVAESALSMGAEEWEHLGSYTTTELLTLNEGGAELKKRTPVRRSQRIRNKVSPLPVRFS